MVLSVEQAEEDLTACDELFNDHQVTVKKSSKVQICLSG